MIVDQLHLQRLICNSYFNVTKIFLCDIDGVYIDCISTVWVTNALHGDYNDAITSTIVAVAIL